MKSYNDKKTYIVAFLFSVFCIFSLPLQALYRENLFKPSATLEKIKENVSLYSNKKRKAQLIKKLAITAGIIGVGSGAIYYYNKGNRGGNFSKLNGNVNEITSSMHYAAAGDVDKAIKLSQINYYIEKSRNKSALEIASKQLKYGLIITAVASFIKWVEKKSSEASLSTPSWFLYNADSIYKDLVYELESNLNLLGLCFDNLSLNSANPQDVNFYVNYASKSFKGMISSLEKLLGFMISEIGEDIDFAKWAYDFKNGVWGNIVKINSLFEQKTFVITPDIKNLFKDLQISLNSMCMTFQEVSNAKVV